MYGEESVDDCEHQIDSFRHIFINIVQHVHIQVHSWSSKESTKSELLCMYSATVVEYTSFKYQRKVLLILATIRYYPTVDCVFIP